MRASDLVRACGCVLTGHTPALAIEITKECPLSCPGCYAYHPEHLGGAPLASLSDAKGRDLVDGVLNLIAEQHPIVVYLVGGEPLLRFRELDEIIPKVCNQGIDLRLVTSAVRPIPKHWRAYCDSRLHIIVSIDGLQPEHDQRRRPATYERILKHTRGHRIVVHCTVTGQMMAHEGYLEEFAGFWSSLPEVQSIWFSLYTPQIGETGPEVLSPEMRRRAIGELGRIAGAYPKLAFYSRFLDSYLNPPKGPEECTFARVTRSFSVDFRTAVMPCQIGGNPDCSECGCLGAVALHAVTEYRLGRVIRLGTILNASMKFGQAFGWLRHKATGNGCPSASIHHPETPVG